MPRRARLDAPGTLHHVIIRGIEALKALGRWRDMNWVRAKLPRQLVIELGLSLFETGRLLGVSTSAIVKYSKISTDSRQRPQK